MRFALVLLVGVLVLFAGCASEESYPPVQNKSPDQLAPGAGQGTGGAGQQPPPQPPPQPQQNVSGDCGAHAAAVLFNLQAFDDSREPEESNCSRMTGTDKLPCVDRDSCQLACYGVWLCREKAWGSQIQFIDLIRDWRADLSSVNDSLEISRALLSNPSASDAGQVVDRIRAIRSAVQRIKANKLFASCTGGSCEDFCPMSQFNSGALTVAEEEALLLKACLE